MALWRILVRASWQIIENNRSILGYKTAHTKFVTTLPMLHCTPYIIV